MAILQLRKQWLTAKSVKPYDLATEFVGIKKFLDDQNNGLSGIDRLKGTGSVTVQTNIVTANYTATDLDTVIFTNSATPLTVTLPDATVMPGRFYLIFNQNTGNVTVNTTSSQLINGNTSTGLPGRYLHVEVYSDGSNWFAI